MKKLLSALVLITVCLMCLTSCTVKFEYADGQLVNKKTNERYNALPIGFEPCGVGDPYGEFGEFKLYCLMDLDGNQLPPETWVTEEYSGSATTVFLNESLPVPAFRDISFDICYICEEDQSVISVAAIESSDEISALISSLDNESDILWPRNDIISSYTLKFYSLEYPAVFYSVNYCITESGNLIYDRATDTCVNIGDMLSEYVSADEG